MGIGPGENTAQTAPETAKGAEESWLEKLKKWLVQCPKCFEIRLVVGANENDRYACKGCGHSFAIKRSRRETTVSDV